MTFSKAFAKEVPGSRFPEWIQVALTESEEAKVEAAARDENIKLFIECLEDAKQLFKEKELKDYQTNVVSTAISLFEKRASHLVYHKEEAARLKFEEKFNRS